MTRGMPSAETPHPPPVPSIRPSPVFVGQLRLEWGTIALFCRCNPRKPRLFRGPQYAGQIFDPSKVD